LTVYEFGKRKKKRDFISCKRVALHWWPVCASPARSRQVQSSPCFFSLPSHFQTLPFSLPLRLLPLQWHHKQRRRAAATAHGYLRRLAPLSARPSTLATLSDTPLVRSLYHPSHPPLSCPLSPKSNLFLTLLLLPSAIRTFPAKEMAARAVTAPAYAPLPAEISTVNFSFLVPWFGVLYHLFPV
jgi:hypothetical protein